MPAVVPSTALIAGPAPLACEAALHPTPVSDRFHLRQASWELFTRFYEENPERRMRLTYADGEMFFMSPLPLHEKAKRLIARFVDTTTDELGLPIASMGSTTWIRSDVKRGIEGDETFYLASEPAVRGKIGIDLTRDPPPDLAIEIDLTHSPIDRPAIYAALGVPELWVYNSTSLTFFKLIDGKYASVPNSVSFPFITPADIERHLAMMPTVDETTIIRSWRQFVRDTNAR